MVNHYQMRSFRLLPGTIEKTAVRIVGATVCHTILLRGTNSVPQGGFIHSDVKFSTIATGCGIDPEQEPKEKSSLLPG
jgi:hypothetical protein